jgi:hypothetical protein
MIKRPNWNSSDWNPPRRAELAARLRQDELRLLDMFHDLTRRYGMKRARQMFANYSRAPNKTEQEELVRLQTLRHLDTMTPKPNVKRLVREMLAEKGIGSGSPRFQNQAAALDKRIRRWKDDRDAIEAKFGGISPKLAPGQPAEFVIHEKQPSRKK